MARTLREWFCSSDFINRHPQVARFVAQTAPHTLIPRRRAVALGAGVGAVIGTLPIPGQCILAALAAIRLNAHLPTAVGITLISNPLTMLPQIGIAWMIGALLLGQPVGWPDAAFWADFTSGNSAWVERAGMPLLVGVMMMASVLGLTLFAAVDLGWRYAIVRKWRRRMQARRR